MNTAAEVIAHRLHRAGCRHAFGIPGGEVLALVDALDSAGLAVQLAKHENCAGFMAEGTWHATGAPGVLFATIGPGIANAVNVIANAWQDRVPLIVLTASVASADRHSYTHQVFDHRAVLAPVTKAAFVVEPGTAAVLIDKAVAIATTGRPGPVVVDVPVDLQAEAATDDVVPTAETQQPMIPAPVPLAAAGQWLAETKRPLVLAGLDAVNDNAANSVGTFCERLGAPLITSYKAKGVIPEDKPLALGGAGLSPRCDEILQRTIAASDCIVLAGYDPIEMRVGWRHPFAPGQRVIEISAEPNTHFMHQAALNFTGHIGATLDALLPHQPRTSSWTAAELGAVKAELRAIMGTDELWGPAAVVDQARQACSRDTIATADSGAHRIVLSQLWECYEPRGLLQSSGLCTMGAAVPLAIGRKLAEPTRPVVAFVGDAGLEMYLGELATIRDLGLGIAIVVFVDQQLALIELKQRQRHLKGIGVDFPATDFSSVADALGGVGATVASRAQLHEELGRAFDQDTFTVISAVVGPSAYDGRI